MSKIVFSIIDPDLLTVILTHLLTPKQLTQSSEVCNKKQRPSSFHVICFSEEHIDSLMPSFTSIPET